MSTHHILSISCFNLRSQSFIFNVLISCHGRFKATTKNRASACLFQKSLKTMQEVLKTQGEEVRGRGEAEFVPLDKLITSKVWLKQLQTSICSEYRNVFQLVISLNPSFINKCIIHFHRGGLAKHHNINSLPGVLSKKSLKRLICKPNVFHSALQYFSYINIFWNRQMFELKLIFS